MEEEEAPAVIAGADAKKSSLCSLCGDAGFPEALLPCRARGCSRVQHTYCGRYCPEMMDDAGRWRCEWCARKKARRIIPSKESPPSSSPSPSPSADTIKREFPDRDKTRASSSSDHNPEMAHAAPTPETCDGGGVTSRALDRWRSLAKRTRLGGKKYRLLADVLCLSASERTSTTPTA